MSADRSRASLRVYPALARPTSNPLAYGKVRDKIPQGALLLFRNGGIIGLVGRSAYTHAAKAIFWGKDLFCVEVREWYGGRAVTLSSQVDAYPGRIDVFETNPDNRWPEFDPEGSCAFMRRLAGVPYGWAGIGVVALYRIPFVRRLVISPDNDSYRSGRPPFCSWAVSMADRIGGGVDPVPQLSDRLTEPADLSRSPFYRYLYTLNPDPKIGEVQDDVAAQEARLAAA